MLELDACKRDEDELLRFDLAIGFLVGGVTDLRFNSKNTPRMVIIR